MDKHGEELDYLDDLSQEDPVVPRTTHKEPVAWEPYDRSKLAPQIPPFDTSVFFPQSGTDAPDETQAGATAPDAPTETLSGATAPIPTETEEAVLTGPTLSYTRAEEEALLQADLQILLDGLKNLEDSSLDILEDKILDIRRERMPQIAPDYPKVP